MRNTRALATAAVAIAASVTAPADATPPHPSQCKGVVQGVAIPGDPGGLISSAAIAVVTGQVECHRDPLNTSVNGLLPPYTGHIGIQVLTDTGLVVCASGPAGHDSVGPVLVMTMHHPCVLPVTHPHRHRPLQAHLSWATMYPYVCCGSITVPIAPLGAGATT